MSQMQGKVAAITSGNSGLGLATAKRLVEEGAFVYITGRRQDELDKATAAIGRNVVTVQGDVQSHVELDRLYEQIAAEQERIHILVANPGIVDPQPLAKISEESFDKAFDINVKDLAFTVKIALPLFRDGGSILVISTVAAIKGTFGYSAYSATKAAVCSLVRTWVAESKTRQIRVNAISPGPIDTPIIDGQAPTKKAIEVLRASFKAAVPLNHFGRAEEVAATVLFLTPTRPAISTAGICRSMVA